MGEVNTNKTVKSIVGSNPLAGTQKRAPIIALFSLAPTVGGLSLVELEGYR